MRTSFHLELRWEALVCGSCVKPGPGGIPLGFNQLLSQKLLANSVCSLPWFMSSGRSLIRIFVKDSVLASFYHNMNIMRSKWMIEITSRDTTNLWKHINAYEGIRTRIHEERYTWRNTPSWVDQQITIEQDLRHHALFSSTTKWLISNCFHETFSSREFVETKG